MPTRIIQQKFTSGELDPKLLARDDFEPYYKSAQKITNMISMPQGGLRVRDGLEYVGRTHRQITRETSPTITAPNGGTGANANDDTTTLLTTTTSIGTTDDYIVVSYDLGEAKDIAAVDVSSITLSAGTSTEFDVEVSLNGTDWTAFSLPEISTTEVIKRTRIRGSYRYVRLIRNGTTDLTATVSIEEFRVWLETSTLSECRVVPFNYNNTNRYILLFTDKNIAVYSMGVFQTDIPARNFTSDRLASINWTQSADTAIIVHPDIPPTRLLRNSDTDWTLENISFDYTPYFDFVPDVSNPSGNITPSATSGTIKITASQTPFSSSDINQYVSGNGGRARITKVNSTSNVTATVEIPFYNTDAIPTGEWAFEQGFELVWSSTRGYPLSVTFHDGRLWFGGSKSLPQTIWASRVGLFFDFDLGSLFDDDAIEVTISDDDVNQIHNIYSHRTLQIFTESAEYAILQSLNEPITPANINIRRQTQRGSKQGLRITEAEGNTFFVQRGGKSLITYLYSELEQSFTNREVSLLSSHLVDEPTDVAMRRATNTDESNVYYMINNSGNLVTVSILLGQDVIAFNEHTTQGTFKNVAVDVDTTYFVIERTLNGVTNNYIERFNAALVSDSAVLANQGLPASIVSGLDHLEGVACKVRVDGYLIPDAQTVSSAEIILDEDATEYAEVGLDFTPYVKLNPVEIAQFGPMTGRKIRISEVAVRLFETVDLKVRTNRFPFRRFGPASTTPFGPPPSVTGQKIMVGLLGWDYQQTVEFTQDSALPLTLLGASMVVEF